jgi:hypothetical protein
VKNASTPKPQRRSGKSDPSYSLTAGAEDATKLPSPGAALPVVGIGASAGGLEALEQFFRQAPADSGLAFVVVQHLDPTQESRLVQLLQRISSMPVAQVVDAQTMLPNHIYVIPPGRDMALLHGVLHLTEPAEQRWLRLPIDHFLRSLAADLRGNAIGVILSGMGSDGTLGLRAIKENAGAAFVQAPDSAKFDAMPRSAIVAGLADVVAPAQELVSRILAFLHHTPALVLAAPAQGLHGATGDTSGVSKVVLLLHERTGHDFSLYRKSTLVRRIERRMGLHQVPRIADYVRLLRESKAEAELLFQKLLIGVTHFFRDPAVWDQIKSEVMPALLAMRPEGGVLRAWVPGCSTGKEAYGLAMVFKDLLEAASPCASLKLQMNEELRTVNHELVSRVDELVHTADDMNNLINSTQVATLFLDAHLGVRRFTPATARLIKLIPSDFGRPSTDLVSALDYPELADDAREVPASDGRWYAAHLLPHRTQDNRIDGVVITFSDIAMAKALESTLHDAQELLARHATDESSEPDATRQLATLLRHAKELLDKRFADQQRAFVRAGTGLWSDMAGSQP